MENEGREGREGGDWRGGGVRGDRVSRMERGK